MWRAATWARAPVFACLLTPSRASPQVDADTTLDDMADAFWAVIDSASYQFDAVARELAELDRITLKDVRTWFAKFLSPASRQRRKLLVQVLGREARAEGGPHKGPSDHLAGSRHHKVTAREVVIADIPLVKSTLDTYPNCNATSPLGGGQGKKR